MQKLSPVLLLLFVLLVAIGCKRKDYVNPSDNLPNEETEALSISEYSFQINDKWMFYCSETSDDDHYDSTYDTLVVVGDSIIEFNGLMRNFATLNVNRALHEAYSNKVIRTNHRIYYLWYKDKLIRAIDTSSQPGSGSLEFRTVIRSWPQFDQTYHRAEIYSGIDTLAFDSLYYLSYHFGKIKYIKGLSLFTTRETGQNYPVPMLNQYVNSAKFERNGVQVQTVYEQ